MASIDAPARSSRTCCVIACVAAEFERRRAACLFERQAALHLLVDEDVEHRADLAIEIAIDRSHDAAGSARGSSGAPA